MNVLYTCDNNYVWLMGISMISLFENNKDVEELSVYLLGEKISEENKNLLFDISKKYSRKCIVVDMPDIKISKSLVSTRWPKSAFSRLYSAELLPKDIERVLYLDCDTIVLQSLKDLDGFLNERYPISGVKDCIGISYRRNIGLNSSSIYINAGVLLLNLNILRTMNISEMIENFLNTYSKTIYYADQDVLNGIFKGSFGVIPAQYDVMTLEYMFNYDEILKLRHPVNYYEKNEIDNAVSHPVIVHFTTNMLNIRPWFRNSNHPMAQHFLYYKSLSPWKDQNNGEMIFPATAKNKLFKFLGKLPRKFEIAVLGVIHSTLLPLAVRYKAK